MRLTERQRALLDALVGQAEIQEMSGASKGLVSMWVKRSPGNGFPAPLVRVGGTRPLFHRAEIRAWLEQRGAK